MNQERINQIALEVLNSFKNQENDPHQTDGEAISEFATKFLARVREEEGKEAVAWRSETGYSQPEYLYHSLPPIRTKGEPLFLHPQEVPEGYALVPIEPTEAMYRTCDNERLAQLYWRKLIQAAKKQS